jgi:hypothetical protein
VEGTNDGAANLVGSGTCGGGGPQSAFEFVAPAAGTYRFVLAPDDELADTLLFARSHCGYDHPSLELGCNDDVAPLVNDRSSAIELLLTQDQTIYLFVDGNQTATNLSGFDGDFVLSAEQL